MRTVKGTEDEFITLRVERRLAPTLVRAVSYHHDTLVDDQHDGGDHGDEIDDVEEIMHDMVAQGIDHDGILMGKGS